MTKETYYAIRIGSRPQHSPYFMLRDDGTVPHLFEHKMDAQDRVKGHPERTVVRVEIRELKIT